MRANPSRLAAVVVGSLLVLAGCGRVEEEATISAPLSHAWTRACLSGAPAVLAPTTLTLAGDTSRVPPRTAWCGARAASYFTFTLDRTSLFHADAFGSSFPAVLGLVGASCVEDALACGAPACGVGADRLVATLGAGTYHLLVGGRVDTDRGPFVLHLQAVPLAGVPLTPEALRALEIPQGDFVLEGTLPILGASIGACGRSMTSAWWWYASCPDASGLFTARTSSTFSKGHGALRWVDVDDGVDLCAPAAAGDLPYVVEATDEPESGLHVLTFGVVGVAMGVPVGEPFVVTGHRP